MTAIKRQHVVIRREDLVAGTRARPEVGVFTQAHTSRPPVPWNRIGPGEKVWMKWSSGPVVAVARVQGLRQIENCSPKALHATARGLKLYDLDTYWASLSPGFFGLTIYLEDERWLDEPFVPEVRSRGESWVVVDGGERTAGWLRAAPEKEDSRSGFTRKQGRGSRTISLSLRFQVLRRDDFRCTYCGRKPPEVVLHIDHAETWSDGGPTTFENLRTACLDCTLGKGARRVRD